MAEEFKILTPRDHIRARTGMYLGSTSIEEVERFVLGVWKKTKYIPALSKMIDEILDNSIDEAIRTKFKYANKIDVSIDGETITVTDNGRGIPQDEVIDNNTGEKILKPTAAWTKVNSGTSFDDNRVTIGTNGIGSAATNFMSTSFVGKTWQNGKMVIVDCSDGGLHVKVATKSSNGNGTSVSFVPDYSLFEISSISEYDTVALIEDRLYGLQMSFPDISFSFNKKKISANDIKKYASLFVEDGASVYIEKSENLSFFISSSPDGLRTNSYINGVNTRQGGVYVDFILNGVADELVSIIKKKHKIDVARNIIKNGLTFVMFAKNFVNPKFDSQTKERLTNTLGNVKDHYSNSSIHDFVYIAKKIFVMDDIILPIINSYLAKKEADEKRDALVAQKKLKKVKVAKHIAANTPNARLLLVEGDSALGFTLKVRNPDLVGAYPLRGVVMNTWDLKPSEVLKNKELSELISILGLDINDPDSVSNMTYGSVATLTDSDHDGAGHISPLLLAFFYKFWPRLFEEGRVQITRSPIVISTNGKNTKWFFTYSEAQDFKANNPTYGHRYIKGLGSLTEEEYDRVINDPMLDTITVDNAESFQMMFGNDAGLRKEFMMEDYR